ncbi:formylglycine-generating enzyme family protein [Crocosphaera sp. XPORK-15E]|uniref:formylglycine-generating enzyme family protein n=1 Tax=Crocosphaera sp. XPORK-15E TaxID=3110247 RepID=UPI002B21ECA0|nr:formylglycine-generating enzyme family protein [Crocosphaera sp. XPORK-15E]MEA5533460.1 formylglycine-generating enzyme family protein [Crocosphaera sp. XPORK-15E]
MLPEDVPLEMVEVPRGRFYMGTEEGEINALCEKFKVEYFKCESPSHLVRVQPFCMGKYPVTQEQWFEIAQETSLKVDIDLNPEPSRFKGVKRPVERVNWYECVEFCKRLSKWTGKDYRLPSEAEWEYACRAETTTPFYFGETITTDLANYGFRVYFSELKGKYIGETTPVAQFPPNAFGLYDMHGNVREWCLDPWHNNYNDAPNDGSVWDEQSLTTNNDEYIVKNYKKLLTDEQYCVVRGGSWLNYPFYCRSAFCSDINRRDVLNVNNGFRVVCVFGRLL